MSNWSDFLKARLTARGWDAARLAAEAGITPSIVSRWMSGAHKPTADRVRAVADALDVPMIEAMIAADIISAKEARVTAVAPDPKLLTDQELVNELSRRLAAIQIAEKAPEAGRRLTSVSPKVKGRLLKGAKQDRGLDEGVPLAAQRGETEARRRKRTERNPEDVPDPDGPEGGA